LRGIPFWWRLVDCSFGVLGFIPVWLCKRWAEELNRTSEWHISNEDEEKRETARF
jgi:hypothetical protein